MITNGKYIQLIIRVFSVFTLSLLLAVFASAQNQKPNILWLSCEDISPYLSMYGDSTAHTPNLDKFAEEATIYTNVYATVAVCAPTRSSIITGMYPISIGTMHMRTGKDVMSWGKRDYSGTSKAIDINGDSVPLYAAVIPEEVKCFTEYLCNAGYYCSNNEKTDYQFAAPVTAWDQNNPKAHWRNRAEGQPFFAVFNHGITHESRMWKNKNLEQTVNPDSVPLAKYFPENPVVRQDVARNYSNIELLDQQIGKLLQQLEDDGLLDNTIVFFFSDHGGPLPRGKRLNYDSGLHTPFMIRFPKNLKQKYDHQLISHVDIAPSMLSLAGVEIPKYIQGQAFLGEQKSNNKRNYVYGSGDRFDEFTDRIRTVRDHRYLYVRNYHPELPAYKDIAYRKNMDMMNELLRLNALDELNSDESYWFRLKKTKEELYDCENDPENLNNLINDPQYKNKIDELSKAMDIWIEKVGDKGAIPEKQMVLEMWPNGVQPITDLPIIKRHKNTVKLSCPTKGASIGYIISNEEIKPNLNSGWTHYHQEIILKKSQYIYVMAQRIGYKESEIMISHNKQ